MQTELVPRRHLFNVRFSEEEQARLEAVCEHLGVNAANLIRMMIREKARELGVEPVVAAAPAPKKTAKKR